MLPYFILSDLLPLLTNTNGGELKDFLNLISLSANVFAFRLLNNILPYSITFTKLLFVIRKNES